MNGNGRRIWYKYDSADRLIRENNNALGKSYFYTYDNNGNITAKESCPFTTGSHTLGTGTVIDYTYDKDKMTKFGSASCVYDKIGNPTTYRGKSTTWRGRQLQSITGYSFKYDARAEEFPKII
ncbi:MAG: hypothetical protein K2L12_06635 [Clostridia bacterium]|nr:hypothetical protein [Clostridia bacterium]